jgi:hypothetical protein
VDGFELHSGRVDRFALRPGVDLLGRALGVFGRVRESKDYRALINPRHSLDDPLIEGAADGAHAYTN